MESLIKVGTMDAFGKRAAILSALDKIREKGANLQRQKANGQVSLFDDNPGVNITIDDDLPEIEEFAREELLALEKELLGFYLSEHPLTPVLAKIEGLRSHKILQLDKDEHRGQKVKITGVVSDLRIVFTRNTNEEMAFVKLEDDSGIIEGVVFPKVFRKTRSYWQKEFLVIAEGVVEVREERISVLIENAQPLEEATKKEEKKEEVDYEITLPARISPKNWWN